MFDAAKNYVYSSPFLKTTISLSSSVLIGIFSNTLVTDLSTPTGIAWNSFYQSLSFYLLLVFFALTLAFHWVLHQFDSDIQKFRDSEFCMAYARSRLLPEQVERYRQDIKDGKMESFNVAMKEIQRVLK